MENIKQSDLEEFTNQINNSKYCRKNKIIFDITPDGTAIICYHNTSSKINLHSILLSCNKILLANNWITYFGLKIEKTTTSIMILITFTFVLNSNSN